MVIKWCINTIHPIPLVRYPIFAESRIVRHNGLIDLFVSESFRKIYFLNTHNLKLLVKTQIGHVSIYY